MAGKPIFTKKHYTTRQLAALVGVSDSKLLSCCSQGLVPGARRLALGWIIPRAGAKFIAKWLALEEQFGTSWLEVVRKMAAPLDEHCQKLQKRSGVRDGRKRLSLKKITRILKLLAAGHTQDVIAAEMDCHYSTVSLIANGERRKLGAKAIEIINQINAQDRAAG